MEVFHICHVEHEWKLRSPLWSILKIIISIFCIIVRRDVKIKFTANFYFFEKTYIFKIMPLSCSIFKIVLPQYLITSMDEPSQESPPPPNTHTHMHILLGFVHNNIAVHCKTVTTSRCMPLFSSMLETTFLESKRYNETERVMISLQMKGYKRNREIVRGHGWTEVVFSDWPHQSNSNPPGNSEFGFTIWFFQVKLG